MLKALFAGSSPVTMFVILCFTMVTSLTVILTIGMALTPFIFDIPVDEVTHLFNDSGATINLSLARYLQTLTNIAFFIIPALVAAYLFSRKPIDYLGLRDSASAKWFATALTLIIVAIPGISLLVALNELIIFPESLAELEKWLIQKYENSKNQNAIYLNVYNLGGLFFNIFMIALLPAIGEELIFRGIVHKIFLKMTGNIHFAIILSAFLFSLLHLQFYRLFPIWLLGVLFGYLMVWSGTIWLPVFAHFINNAAIVIAYFLINRGIAPEEIKAMATNTLNVPAIIISIILCSVILWIMYKNKKKY